MANPFDVAHKNLDRSILPAEESAKFEHARVDYLMNRLKLGAFKRDVERLGGVTADFDRLTFAAFAERFPTFPFRLGANTLKNLPLPVVDKTTPPDYQVHRDALSAAPATFKKFHRVPFVAAYVAFTATLGAEARSGKTGLVFPRKGLAHGLVIHNDETEEYWQRGLCWVYKPRKGGRLFVQPFTALVEAIYSLGRGWQPS